MNPFLAKAFGRAAMVTLAITAIFILGDLVTLRSGDGLTFNSVLFQLICALSAVLLLRYSHRAHQRSHRRTT